MSDLNNSHNTLKRGLVTLLRDKVDGWSFNQEYNVENVWPKAPPTDSDFPFGTIDIIAGEDTELSEDLEISLREVIVKVLVVSDNNEEPGDFVDKSEDAIREFWDSEDNYIGDWTFKSIDGYTPLVENNNEKGKLRYNESRDFVFETVKLS